MKNEELFLLSFTERGRALAERLRGELGGEADCARDGIRLHEWTAERFPVAKALIFVGAAGIAVRAIAPYLVHKADDPAVVCVDEGGSFAIPLVSGHLGGANELAREIARILGATAVITTATDVNGVFAADEWARVQGCAVSGTEHIKAVSGKLLSGEPVEVKTLFPVEGEPPEGVELSDTAEPDVWVDVRPHAGLVVAPRALCLGIGCRRGVTKETLEARFAMFCHVSGVLPESIAEVATIDLKADEKGLLAFCTEHGWNLKFYTAEELSKAKGTFTASDFVETQIGVDNVCERAAMLLAGMDGDLFVRKFAGEGVTFALFRKPVRLDWRWRNG